MTSKDIATFCIGALVGSLICSVVSTIILLSIAYFNTDARIHERETEIEAFNYPIQLDEPLDDDNVDIEQYI